MSVESEKRSRDQIELMKDEMVKLRETVKMPCFEAVLRSLEELEGCAAQCKVQSGIENRAHFFEIPNFEEIGILLDRFHNSSGGYRHDTGHAQIFENLGFVQHQTYLDRFGSRLPGIHLHDCRVNHDHLVPGKGDASFEMIAQYLHAATIKVLEVNDFVSTQQVRGGLSFLEQRGIV